MEQLAEDGKTEESEKLMEKAKELKLKHEEVQVSKSTIFAVIW